MKNQNKHTKHKIPTGIWNLTVIYKYEGNHKYAQKGEQWKLHNNKLSIMGKKQVYWNLTRSIAVTSKSYFLIKKKLRSRSRSKISNLLLAYEISYRKHIL